MANFKDEEMSMEDILSSIRKYVSEEDTGKSNTHSTEYSGSHEIPSSNSAPEPDDVISLGQEDVAEPIDVAAGTATVDFAKEQVNNSLDQSDVKSSWTADNHKNISSPFNKLAEALKTYGKNKRNSELSLDMSVEQFIRTVIENYLQKWMNANLNRMVEDIIKREIDRLKSE